MSLYSLYVLYIVLIYAPDIFLKRRVATALPRFDLPLMPKRLKKAIEKVLRLAFLISFEMLLAIADKFLKAFGCRGHKTIRQ